MVSTVGALHTFLLCVYLNVITGNIEHFRRGKKGNMKVKLHNTLAHFMLFCVEQSTMPYAKYSIFIQVKYFYLFFLQKETLPQKILKIPVNFNT